MTGAVTDPDAAAVAQRLARLRSRVRLGPVFVFVGTAALLAAVLRFADSATTASVHGQAVVSSIERAMAGLLGAVKDAAAVATVGGLYAAVLLCARTHDRDGRASVTPVAWRLQRTAGLAAAGWAVLAVAQIPFGLARLIREPVGVAWNAGYLYEYLTGFAAGRLQLLAALLVPVAGVLARAGLRRGTARVALLLASAALVAQTLAGAQFQPQSSLIVAALVLHVLGIAGWAGGVVAILTLARLNVHLVVPVLRRHSLWATMWVALVGSSGVLLSTSDLATPAELVTTFAGRLVLAKVGLFIAVLGVGWAIRRRLPDLVRSTRLPGRLLLCEIVLFGCAVGVAAALSLS